MKVRGALAIVSAVAFGAFGVARPSAAAPPEKPPVRVAFVGPLTGRLAKSGEESLLGVRYAALWKGEQGRFEGRAIQVQAIDDQDDPAGAERAYAAAIKAKADLIVAAPTGRTVEALAARARREKERTPTCFVGSAHPKPTIDPRDPVLHAGSYPVDHALELAMLLAMPCNSVAPGILHEDTARGREVAAALERNLGPRQALVGSFAVPAGGAPVAADLEALRAKKCDRLVLIGEPDLLDATVEALAAAGWKVPLLAAEGMVSAAAASAFDASKQDALAGSYFVVGSPQITVEGPPSSLYRVHEKKAGSGARVEPRTLQAFTAADLMLEGLAEASSGNRPPKDDRVLAAIRDLRYGEDESKMPMFDLCGYAALYRWRVWKAAPKGPEPFDVKALPAEGFGPLLRVRSPARYVAEPGTKVVWLTFAEPARKKASTIAADLQRLGLSTRGYEPHLDQWILDDLMARAMGKLNRLFLRNEDGTAIPGVSFAISFTTTKPEHLKPHEYWTALVAGDDAEAGGRAWPGDGYCEIYSTFLERTIFRPHALDPPITTDDKPFVEGTYPWRLEPAEHRRPDAIRCLVDGYAGSFALTGAHEIGHLASLDHDVSDPRSIMNVAEGAGLRETQAWFVPAHAEILEKVLGRVPDAKPKK